MADERAVVAASNHKTTGPHPGGTIAQWEHDAALAEYVRRYPTPPWTHERPTTFAWFELIGLLGHEPTTFEPHPPR